MFENPPKPTKAKAKKQTPLSILMSVKEEIARSVPEDDYDEEAAFLRELKHEQAIADANEAIFEQHDWAAIPTQTVPHQPGYLGYLWYPVDRVRYPEVP